jgi:CBS domain-containing protein
MQVQEIMTHGAVVIDPNTTIRDAGRRMRDHHVGAMPACESDRLIGIVTDRDIVVRAVAEAQSAGNTTVRQVMSESVFYCLDDDEVEQAAGIMAEHRVRRLPVLSRDERLVGMVTLTELVRSAPDVAKGALKRNAGQAAADLLPGAAASNRSVFYDRDTGRARTVGEIYKMFAHSIETKQSQFADASVTGSGSTAASSGAGGFSSLHGRSFAPPSSTGATTASIGGDMPGPTLSLLSILALAALDPPDPVKAINGKTDSQGNRIDNQSQQPQNTPVLDRTQTRSYDRTI